MFESRTETVPVTEPILDEGLRIVHLALEAKTLIRRLDEILQDAGYYHLYLSFGDGNTRFNDISRWVDSLNTRLSTLCSFFLLGRKVSIAALEGLIGSQTVATFIDLGLFLLEGNDICFGNLRLIKFRNLSYIFEFSSDPEAYYGDDSVALAVYQTAVHGSETLDLCCGPGIQMLIAAQTSESSIGVEINAKAALIAAINATLNRLDRKTTIYHSDLFDFANRHRGRFDLITFNPPLLPVPTNLQYPFVGHGGPDGMDVTRKIVDAFHSHLKAEGCIAFIGTTLTTEDRAGDLDALLREIGQKGKLIPQATITCHNKFENGNSFYEGLISTTSGHHSQNPETVRASFEALVNELGRDQFVCFSCIYRNKTEEMSYCLDLSKQYYGGWFV